MNHSFAAPTSPRVRATVLATLRLTLSAAVIACVAACSDNGQASSITAPASGSLRSDVSLSTAHAGRVLACISASSPAGAYTFTGTELTMPRAGDVVSSPVAVNHVVGTNECATIFLRASAPSTIDGQAWLLLTQSGPAGQSVSLTCAPDSPYLRSDCNDPAVASANINHGDVVTYSYSAVSGSALAARCALSQGWFSNQGAARVTAKGLFFDTGASWTTVLNGGAKNSAYYILARQFIAARLNIDAGGSPPAAVQAALVASEDFFSWRPLDNMDGVSKSTLTSWANTLENFNTGGVNGWPHCG
jgi:hypothetical protein